MNKNLLKQQQKIVDTFSLQYLPIPIISVLQIIFRLHISYKIYVECSSIIMVFNYISSNGNFSNIPIFLLGDQKYKLVVVKSMVSTVELGFFYSHLEGVTMQIQNDSLVNTML